MDAYYSDEELKRRADEARRRTDEYVKRMAEIKRKIKRITLSAKETEEFFKGLIMYEEMMKHQTSLDMFISNKAGEV